MRLTISVSIVIVFMISLMAIISSCKHDPLTPTGGVTPTDTTTTNPSTVSTVGWKCSPDTVYFQFDVLPIMVSSCAPSGCHNAATKADGYQLTDYTNVIKKGISAGRATNSKIYTEIANGSMPPKNSGITMTQAQKDIIAKWINQGAKNLSCNPSFGQCDTMNVKFSSFVALLVQNKCQGCHNSTLPLLTNYTQIKASVQSGKFAGSINHTAGFSAMPQGSAKLPTCELNKINAWIKAGALNN
jgi:uncharacterized membrane protein